MGIETGTRVVVSTVSAGTLSPHTMGGTVHTVDSWAGFKTKISDAVPLADVDFTALGMLLVGTANGAWIGVPLGGSGQFFVGCPGSPAGVGWESSMLFAGTVDGGSAASTY